MFLPALQQQHPRLQIQLVHERSQVLNEMVISSRLDFAIVTVAVPHPELVSLLLGRDHFGIWAHSTLDVDPEQTLLMLDPNVKQTEDLLRELERRKRRFRRIFTSSSIDTLWALAEAGHGA